MLWKVTDKISVLGVLLPHFDVLMLVCVCVTGEHVICSRCDWPECRLGLPKCM